MARVKKILDDMLKEDVSGYIIRSRFQGNASYEIASYLCSMIIEKLKWERIAM